MSVANIYWKKHLEAAEERWNDAYKRMESLLQHSDPIVAELTVRLFTVCDQTRWSVFGGMETGFAFEAGSYDGAPHDPCELMEFVYHFVSYSMLKHWEPGLAYFRYGD